MYIQMSWSKTGESWTRLVNCINDNILVVICIIILHDGTMGETENSGVKFIQHFQHTLSSGLSNNVVRYALAFQFLQMRKLKSRKAKRLTRVFNAGFLTPNAIFIQLRL